MSVFIDTSAFLAVMQAEDNCHEAARDVWERLVTGRAALYTSNYVVVETVALLQRRFGNAVVRRFCSDLLPMVTVEWVSPDAHAAGLGATIAGSRSGPSFVDCVSFELISRLGIASVFVFDRHFEDRGFRL